MFGSLWYPICPVTDRSVGLYMACYLEAITYSTDQRIKMLLIKLIKRTGELSFGFLHDRM